MKICDTYEIILRIPGKRKCQAFIINLSAPFEAQCISLSKQHNVYTRAFQLKSTAGRTPINVFIRRAAWSKINGAV